MAILGMIPIVLPAMRFRGDRTLRVCADPDNVPFSNRHGDGFENRIAHVIARDLHATVAYTWWPEQRGFLRHTLAAGRCDVVIGIAPGTNQVLTTTPYYCSSYVMVARHDRHYRIRSFDDPRLRALRIGVPVIGNDYNSLPPVVALARRGLVHHVVGYSLSGDTTTRGAWFPLLDAVARGDVDVAVAWGPPAGYYGQHTSVPLDVTAVPAASRDVPLVYAIALGVRHADAALRAELEGALARQRGVIRQILRAYGVPIVRGAAHGPSAEAALSCG